MVEFKKSFELYRPNFEIKKSKQKLPHSSFIWHGQDESEQNAANI